MTRRENGVADPRYPIGEFEHSGEVSSEQARQWIDQIERAPAAFRAAVEGLSDAQLDTRYRPGGWTLRQVVHHVGDSHLNSYVRFKWALTEDEPAIKTYYEDRWAELADYREVPIALALDFLELLHAKWVILLRVLTPAELDRRLQHPEWGAISLDRMLGIYAWHCRHHLAHITTTIEREGW